MKKIYYLSTCSTCKKIMNSLDLKDFELRSVIEVLYQARCNLFHGDKSGDSARDKIIIKACIPVLKSLVREFNYNNPPEM